jgi:hypothetical protein
MEEAHLLISGVYAKPTHLEASNALSEFEAYLLSHSVTIDTYILKQTRKISQKFGLSLYGHIPKLYLKYLKLVNKANTELLIELCNDALLVKDSLTGTEIGDQLQSAVKEALIYLIQQSSLDSQQTQVVQQLLETKPSVNFEEELFLVIDEIENNSPVGVHMLIELFSSLQSTKDQLSCFSSHLGPFIKSLSSRRPVEMYSLTIRFLDIFLPPLKLLLQLPDNQCEYEFSLLPLFSHYEDVFYTSLSLLKLLLKSDRYINECSVKLLYKLWNLYPSLRSHLFELILGNFKTINSSSSPDPKRKAAEFLYAIIHDRSVDGDFKGRLEAEGLDSLFADESYDAAVLPPIALQDLKLNATFPVCCEIPPGERFAHYVEVAEPCSVLFWGFATEEMDISYSISRMDTVEEVLCRGERVECDSKPVIGSLFVPVPGLYRFQWDNAFSWFRSKKVRFRICVLVPVRKGRGEKEVRTIRVINPDDIGDLCYVIPEEEYEEIGFAVYEKTVEVFKGEVSEIRRTPADDVKDIIDRCCSLAKSRTLKVGIVEKSVLPRPYDFSLGCFAVCRDVDAFALLNYDSLQVHTLIAILDQDGLRSSVISCGHLLPNGDVSHLSSQDAPSAISTLLNLFGPATVVFHSPDVEKLVSRVRLAVAPGIWSRCQVVFSSFSLSECAARLHFLLSRHRSLL